MGEVELLRQEVAQLRAEVDRVDEWANGLFCVLLDALPLLLRRQPEVASRLAPMWRTASERFDEVSTATGQDDSFEETLERLESRKILYRTMALLKIWPEHG